eukprot:431803-Rhodomonas_salina.1
MLFVSGLHVEHVPDHVVRHVARDQRAVRPVHHKSTVKVHGVPPDFVGLTHPVELCRCDSAYGAVHHDQVAAVAGDIVTVAGHFGILGRSTSRSGGLGIRPERVRGVSLDQDVAGKEAYFGLVLMAPGVVGPCRDEHCDKTIPRAGAWLSNRLFRCHKNDKIEATGTQYSRIFSTVPSVP